MFVKSGHTGAETMLYLTLQKCGKEEIQPLNDYLRPVCLHRGTFGLTRFPVSHKTRSLLYLAKQNVFNVKTTSLLVQRGNNARAN